MKNSILIAAAFALTLSSCGKNEPSQDTSESTPATPMASQLPSEPVKSIWDESSTPVVGATLTVSPTEVDLCTEKNAKVEVSWDVSTLEVKNPQIWIRSPKGEKIWIAFKQKTGTKATGNWVKAHTEFLLVDSTTKKVLNKVGVISKACS